MMLQFEIYLICYSPIEQEKEHEVVDYISVLFVETKVLAILFCNKNVSLSTKLTPPPTS
jgi:hypothetical protein